MFGIGRLFARRAARKRAIFHYHDGQRNRWADPLVVESALEGSAGGEDWQAQVLLVRHLNRPAPPGLTGKVADERLDARRRETGKLLYWIREAFGIIPLSNDGMGLTEAETIGVLTEYLLFIGGLADAARPLAESPSPAAASLVN